MSILCNASLTLYLAALVYSLWFSMYVDAPWLAASHPVVCWVAGAGIAPMSACMFVSFVCGVVPQLLCGAGAGGVSVGVGGHMRGLSKFMAHAVAAICGYYDGCHGLAVRQTCQQ